MALDDGGTNQGPQGPELSDFASLLAPVLRRSFNIPDDAYSVEREASDGTCSACGGTVAHLIVRALWPVTPAFPALPILAWAKVCERCGDVVALEQVFGRIAAPQYRAVVGVVRDMTARAPDPPVPPSLRDGGPW